MSGGTITPDYTSASHVLIYKYNFGMEAVIKKVVKLGVWCLHFDWLLKCLADGTRYPELGYHYEGGAPILLEEVVEEVEDEDEAGASTGPGTRATTGSKTTYWLSSEQMARTLTEVTNSLGPEIASRAVVAELIARVSPGVLNSR